MNSKIWDGNGGGDDMLQIMEEIGVEQAKTNNFYSKTGKMLMHEESEFKPFQRAGKEMRRIIFLGKRSEREGD
jgi:hypothetical protein